MQFNSQCIACLIKRQMAQIAEFDDEQKKLDYMKDVCRIIAESPEGVAAPYLVSRFGRAFDKYFHIKDVYAEIKKESNDFVLERLDRVQQVIDSSDDPLLCALKYARLGNYIDFGALHGGVDMSELDKKLDSAKDEAVDPVEYENLKADLAKAKKVLYITDNAGEIVLDKIFLQKLKEYYPNAEFVAATRGAPVINDATREDAYYIGLDKIVKVIDNGTDISGTQISEVGEEMKKALDDADVIIAKGQGNFETMLGCGLNAYYVYLCKCDLFVKSFGVPRLTGVLFNEKRVSIKWNGLK